MNATVLAALISAVAIIGGIFLTHRKNRALAEHILLNEMQSLERNFQTLIL